MESGRAGPRPCPPGGASLLARRGLRWRRAHHARHWLVGGGSGGSLLVGGGRGADDGTGRATDAGRARQLQPRHPADPLEQLLPLPRAGRDSSARPNSTSTPKEGAFLERRHHRPRQRRGERAVKRITNPDPKERMPPPDSGHALTDQQIALLRRWIDEGAKWDTHWAFTAPVRPDLPAVKHAGVAAQRRSIASSWRGSNARA